MIRKILVPVRGDGKGENVLAHASVMARRYGAHIDVVHCRPKPDEAPSFGRPLPRFLREQLAESAAGVADAEEEKLHRDFDRIAGDLKLPIGQRPDGPGPSASWIEEVGKQADVLKRRGRLADLIVVAKPDRDRNLGVNSLVAAIFHTGRPVMMVPPREERPAALGERVTLAWNGSLEAARAVALTLDVLVNAAAVTVLTVEGRDAKGASPEDLRDYLAVRGIAAAFETLTAEGGVGAALLRRSAELGADLMIMGAYSASHEREAIFGGNSQVIVDKAGLPIIFVH